MADNALLISISALAFALVGGCTEPCKEGYGMAADGVCYPIDMDGESDDEDADATDGADGADGTDGADGSDGADGADGGDGADGSDGTDGSDGADGGDGADGADGSDGTDGGADGTDGGDGGEDGGGTEGTLGLGAENCDDACALTGDCGLLSGDEMASCSESCDETTNADFVACVDSAETCTEVEDSCLDLVPGS
jgi:hypothetical protein